MKILYGTILHHYDVTTIAHKLLSKDGIIYIPPQDDIRASLFSDPIYRVVKKIYIIDGNHNEYHFSASDEIYINTVHNKIYTQHDVPNDVRNICFTYKDLKIIQENICLKHGCFYNEIPEQIMAMRYINKDSKVLEIGGNVGRNSLLISYILNNANSSDLVTLESDEGIAQQLKENRDANSLTFHIESCALSKRNLIQRGWDTIVSDVVLDGYKSVNTITLDDIRKKYNINFNTLVLDCEGAFYYILMDMPEILNNIKTIIMENDYNDVSHKKYIDDTLLKNGFITDFSCPGAFHKSSFNCHDNFFEVWTRS